MKMDAFTVDKQKEAVVKYIGDEDVVEHVTVISNKKTGRKKGDIIYENLKADEISQETDSSTYEPSTALFSGKNDVEGKCVFQVSPLKINKKTLKVTKSTKKRKISASLSKSNSVNESSEQNISSKQKSQLTTEEGAQKKANYHLRQRKKESVRDVVAESDPENSDENSWDSSGTDSITDEINELNLDNAKEKQKKTFAEDYFYAQKQTKSVTSNRTLSKVDVQPADIEKLQHVTKSAPEYHKNEKKLLLHHYSSMFKEWMFFLQEGFSILLYGIGSKYEILQNFCLKFLEDSMYITINGFFPSLTVKQILSMITEDILDHNGTFSNIYDHAEFIVQEFNLSKNQLYVIFHNIDGLSLRSMKMQSIISHLASCSQIHFLASIEHINAALIWDQVMLSHFKWIWYDATTFEPYILETSYENSLLRKSSSHLLLSSLLHVYRSLTPNGQGVFLILAKHQMEKKDKPGYLGITFHEWYHQCREAFLVNSELTMNAQLSEFKNHKLLSSKRSSDGLEYWYIPVDNNTLIQFLEKEEERK